MRLSEGGNKRRGPHARVYIVTRDEIVEIASNNLPVLRKVLRRRVRNISDSLIDDCCQEAFLWVLENWTTLQRELGFGIKNGQILIKHMSNAASRFIYANRKSNGAVSLSHPLSDEADSAELGDLVIDATTLDPERAADCRRVANAMAVLSGSEAKILMAFADDVPLDEIAAEHDMTIVEILTIKKDAAEKIKAHCFAKVLARSMFTPLRSLDMSKYGSLA